MGKPWCAFSAPVRANASHLVFAVAVLAGLSLGLTASSRFALAQPANSASAPAPSPSPEIDPAFLKLPAYDLEAVASEAVRGLKVGDSVLVRVNAYTVDNPMGYKLEAPKGAEPASDSGFSIEPYSPRAGEPVPAAPNEVRFRISAIRAGRLQLPSLAIQDPAGTAVGRTNPWSIDVATTIEQKQGQEPEAVPPRPPVDLSIPLWLLILLGVGLIGLIYGAVKAFRIWKNANKQPAPPKPAEPEKPEDDEAVSALEELLGQGLMRKQQYKPHYFRATEILKRYLGRRYDFDASESTAREIIASLEQKRLPDGMIDRLEKLFTHMDRVKFADQIPTADEGQKICDEIRQTVSQSRRPKVMAITPSNLPPTAPRSTPPTRIQSILLFVLLSAAGSSRTAQASPLNTDVPVEAYLENKRGVKAFKDGKIEEAQKNFGAAQALNPSLPELQFNQSTVQMESGDVENAVTGFESAASNALKKNNPALAGRSFFNEGAAQAKKSDLGGAIQSYLKAIGQAHAANDTQLEADARKNLELLARQQQQQKQQEKEGKQGKDKKDQKDGAQQDKNQKQGGGSKSGDQKDDQKEQADNKDDKKKDGQGDKEKDQAKNFQDPSKGRQRQFRSLKLSKEDADRVMAELSGREKDLQGRLKKGRGAPQTNSKDW